MWCILYGDKYVRMVECFDVDRTMKTPHGIRVQFTLHYGRESSQKDANGCPKQIKSTDIRFDLSTDQHKAHLHYQGEDHIAQSRVSGLEIRSLSIFDFIKGIEQHRATGDPLHDCFGFKVTV